MKRAPAVSLLAVFVFASLAGAAIERVTTIPEAEGGPIVADLDRNGLDDLVIDGYVLLNQGGGTFVKHDLEPVLGKGAFVLDRLDFNGDGHLDLMTKNWDGRPPGFMGIPAFRLHAGGATPLQFGTPIGIDNGGDSTPHVGDLDGDGRDDLLLMKPAPDGARMMSRALMTPLISRGDGTFTKRTSNLIPYPNFGVESDQRVLVGDLNHDGLNDMVLWTKNDLAIFIGKGGGEFDVRFRFIPAQRFAGWEKKLADIDGDGHLDLVTVYPRVVHVLFGDGRGDFSRHAMVFLPIYRVATPPAGTSGASVNPFTSTPRNLMLGEFVKKGRTEILGSLAEGDIFVLAWENGRLREVAARVPTEFIQGEVFAGSFRKPGSTDFIVTFNGVGGPGWPKPGLFTTDPEEGPKPVVAAPARSRRVRAVARPKQEYKLTVSVGNACGVSDTNVEFEMDGMWGSSADGKTVEVMRDSEDLFYFRFFPSWHPYGVWGTAQPGPGGRWEGSVFTYVFVPGPCEAGMARFVIERVR